MNRQSNTRTGTGLQPTSGSDSQAEACKTNTKGGFSRLLRYMATKKL